MSGWAPSGLVSMILAMNDYRVTGPRPWRQVPVGEVAQFDPDDPSVQRAVDIGVLTLVTLGRIRGLEDRVTAPKGSDEEPVVSPENGGS